MNNTHIDSLLGQDAIVTAKTLDDQELKMYHGRIVGSAGDLTPDVPVYLCLDVGVTGMICFAGAIEGIVDITTKNGKVYENPVVLQEYSKPVDEFTSAEVQQIAQSGKFF